MITYLQKKPLFNLMPSLGSAIFLNTSFSKEYKNNRSAFLSLLTTFLMIGHYLIRRYKQQTTALFNALQEMRCHLMYIQSKMLPFCPVIFQVKYHQGKISQYYHSCFINIQHVKSTSTLYYISLLFLFLKVGEFYIFIYPAIVANISSFQTQIHVSLFFQILIFSKVVAYHTKNVFPNFSCSWKRPFDTALEVI